MVALLSLWALAPFGILAYQQKYQIPLAEPQYGSVTGPRAVVRPLGVAEPASNDNAVLFRAPGLTQGDFAARRATRADMHYWTRPRDRDTVRSYGYAIYDAKADSERLSGLSDACTAALTTRLECGWWIARFKIRGYRFWPGEYMNTYILCNPRCASSLKSWFENVEASCDNPNDGGAPPNLVGGLMWAGYNETCLQEQSTDFFCNEKLQRIDKLDRNGTLSDEDLCSSCHIQRLRMMQSSAYSGYDRGWQERLEYVYSRCGLTGPTDVPPSVGGTPTVKRRRYPTDRMYTMQAEDTFDSVALAFGVSSAALYVTNQDRIYNRDFDGLHLRLPLPCHYTHTYNENDTCKTLEAATGMDISLIKLYNPWILDDCRNLKWSGAILGHVLCLAAAGDPHRLEGNDRITFISPQEDTFASGWWAAIGQRPPAKVAPGTDEHSCAKWHTVTSAEETCAQICVKHRTCSRMFHGKNPSLSLENCDKSLLLGHAYCVRDAFDIDPKSFI